jgi:hypothetical protein
VEGNAPGDGFDDFHDPPIFPNVGATKIMEIGGSGVADLQLLGGVD